ncbi:MAG: bifunctional diguanylate cyclase/phosphodiesterase [Rhodospirillaceae bacterium]|nr:bifunctional diguanylate cyclase/phosphodiesterase [Rhodospirillaceae bacterium]
MTTFEPRASATAATGSSSEAKSRRRAACVWAGLACVIIIATMVVLTIGSYERHRDSARRDLLGRTSLLASHAEQVLGQVVNRLDRVADTVRSGDAPAGQVDATAVAQSLGELSLEMPHIRGLALLDGAGALQSGIGEAIDLDAAQIDLMADLMPEPSVPDLLVGTVPAERTTAGWYVAVGRLLDADGDGDGLRLVALVDPSDLIVRQPGALPFATSSYLVARDSAVVLALATVANDPLGAEIGEPLALAEAPGPAASLHDIDQHAAGSARVIGAYATLPDMPVAAVVATDFGSVLTPWLPTGVLFPVFTLLFIGATATILRQELMRTRRLRDRLQEMSAIASTDKVTGLANRDTFSLRLTESIAHARRTRQPTGVLVMDLDRFNEINDTFGHSVGDRLLRQFAERIKRRVRQSDTVARIGGDEFAIIANAMTETEDASVLASSIVADLSVPFVIDHRPIHTTVSVGVVVCPDDGTDAGLLLQRVDSALHRAKEQGPGNVHLFDGERDRIARERRRMETKMREGLERGEFSLCYQPKFCGRTRRLVGLEALSRWIDGEGTIVSPGVFIPIAESSGFIHELGSWALHTACAQQVAWRDAGLPSPMVAVNISPRQFRHGDIAGLVRRVINETGIDPHDLEIEITESMLMQDVNRAELQLYRLADQGISVAVDDFGTGYSSLAYLKRFPVTSLKIDRSFVKDILQDPDDLAIVQAIVTMGKSLGLTIVAEGVETEEQFQLLSGLDCDVIQGFLLGRPSPPDAIETLHLRQAVAAPAPAAPPPLVGKPAAVVEPVPAMELPPRRAAADGAPIRRRQPAAAIPAPAHGIAE